MSAWQGTTQDRINFVCATMRRGSATTRNFDSCLEMGDGDEVAAGVYQRALANPRLMEALPRYLCPTAALNAYNRKHGIVSPKAEETQESMDAAKLEQLITALDDEGAKLEAFKATVPYRSPEYLDAHHRANALWTASLHLGFAKDALHNREELWT